MRLGRRPPQRGTAGLRSVDTDDDLFLRGGFALPLKRVVVAVHRSSQHRCLYLAASLRDRWASRATWPCPGRTFDPSRPEVLDPEGVTALATAAAVRLARA